MTPLRFLVTRVFGWGVKEQQTLSTLRRFFTAVTGRREVRHDPPLTLCRAAIASVSRAADRNDRKPR